MLGVVHRFICVTYQDIRRRPVERIGRNADAGRQMQLDRIDVVGLAERQNDIVGSIDDAPGILGFDQHQEFIAAQTGRHLSVTEQGLQPRAGLFQDCVAIAMPQ